MVKTKVGVFNVLAGAMSACSDIYDYFEGNDTNNIFELFKDLSSVDKDTLNPMEKYIGNKKVVIKGDNIDEFICNKLNITIGDLDQLVKIVNTKNLNQAIQKAEGETPKNQKNIDSAKAAKQKAINGKKAFNNDALIEAEQIEKTAAEAKEAAPAPANADAVEKLKAIYDAKSLSFEEFVVFCISKGKYTLSGFLKNFSMIFPYSREGMKKGKGMGLYGGFKLGDQSTKKEIPINICQTSEFKTDFYTKKKKFIEKQITEFFNGENPAILVCPEFDYMVDVPKGVTELKVGVITEGARKKIEHIIIPANNFCRSIFYKGLENKREEFSKDIVDAITKVKKAKTQAEYDDKFKKYTAYLEDVKVDPTILEIIKPKETDIKEKENVDVRIFGEKKSDDESDDERASERDKVLISVHLDSSTDMSSMHTKKREIATLIKLVETIKDKYQNNEIIIAGDFNFPYFRDEELEEEDEKYYVKGFNGYPYDTSEKINGVPKKDINVWWKKFQTDFQLTSPGNIGVCLKERFTTSLGNDQLWEGKGDKRAYNTDFVGLWDNKATKGLSINPLKEVPHENLILHPYIKQSWGIGNAAKKGRTININDSWLSDHALVYSTINKFTSDYVAEVNKEINIGNREQGYTNLAQLGKNTSGTITNVQKNGTFTRTTPLNPIPHTLWNRNTNTGGSRKKKSHKRNSNKRKSNKKKSNKKKSTRRRKVRKSKRY